MLLRLDPDRGLIAMMSIPRDLKVEIPGYGTDKFNDAYSYGGPKLTLQTVKQLTGLPINHVVNVDFLGFARAVNAIGCVYVDVDHRYYHSNVGLSPSEHTPKSTSSPATSCSAASTRSQYVRYRHTDNDIVRSARQQDFLRDARQRVSLEDLVFDQSELIEIFTEYTTSDISDGETMLRVLKLFVASRNAPIKEVHFPAELGPSYVYATHECDRRRREGIPRRRERAPEAARAQPPSREEAAAGKKQPEAPSTQEARRRRRSRRSKSPSPASDGLVPAREAGEAEAKIAARKRRRRLPDLLPDAAARGPTSSKPTPTKSVVDPHVYRLKDEDGDRHVAYRMVAGDGRVRRQPLLRRAGDPRLGGPADPRQPERDARRSRARVRDLRRRRTG